MAKIERTYNVPLRKEFQKAPKYKRAKKAITALKQFLQKHMKSEDIKLGKYVNELIWQRGIKNPPHHVKIQVLKDEENIVYAELEGKPLPLPKDKKEEKKESAIKDKLAALKKKVQEKPEEKKEEKKEKEPSIKIKTKTALDDEENKEAPSAADTKKEPKDSEKKTEKKAEKPKTAKKE